MSIPEPTNDASGQPVAAFAIDPYDLPACPDCGRTTSLPIREAVDGWDRPDDDEDATLLCGACGHEWKASPEDTFRANAAHAEWERQDNGAPPSTMPPVPILALAGNLLRVATCDWARGGLAVVYDPDPRMGGKECPWTVVQANSGATIHPHGHWAALHGAVGFAERILPLADWTAPLDSLRTQAGLLERVHAELCLPGITADEVTP